MKALVLSHTHGLLPIAWRLVREGADVQVAVAKPRFAGAWKGKFAAILPASKRTDPEHVAAVRAVVEETSATVLTDSILWTERLAELPGVFGQHPDRTDEGKPIPPMQISAWFDGTEFSAHHVLVEDLGAWPGGLGPRVPGAMTMIRTENAILRGLLGEALAAHLAGAGFRGLVSAGLSLSPERVLTLSGIRCGWRQLHAEAFVAALDSLSAVLAGAPPELLKRFTMAVPVTLPPWPTPCNVPARVVALEDLPKAVLQRTFLHDVTIPNDGKVETAGLDGLVGVVVADADGFDLARSRTLQVAGELAQRLPEPQFRTDAGGNVGTALSLFEEIGVPI